MTSLSHSVEGYRRYLLAGLSLLLIGCSESAPETDSNSADVDRGEPVITQKVEHRFEEVYVEAVGTSRALKSITIEPSVTGEVTEVNFSANQYVEKGQVLVRLDDRDQKLAVELAEVELEEAQRRLDRYRRSVDSGGVTQSDLDNARSQADRARIALQRAKVQLDYHTIEAPFSGFVGLTDLDPGAWISPDTAITTLDDRRTLLVNFQLPELLLGELSPGQTIQLSTWSDRVAIAEGEVVDIDSRVDPDRRTFTLRAHVNNEEDRLRPGMSFRIQLSLKGNRYPVVPEISLQWGDEGAYVWMVEEGKVTRVPATIVQRREGGVLVDANLPKGVGVVSEGVHAMREGTRVRLLNDELDADELAWAESDGE